MIKINNEEVKYRDYLMKTNNFREPVVLKNGDAIAYAIIRLLLLEKGTIQSHPDMGIGLLSTYRGMDTSEIYTLQLDIEKQMATYLPKYQLTQINLSIVDINELRVDMTIDGSLYSFTTDSKNNTLRLSDL